MTRHIILYLHTTIDGVVTGDPNGDKEDFGGAWTREGNLVGEASETLVRLFDRIDTLLMGHGSYDSLSGRWPSMQGSVGAVDITSRLAAKVNGAHKLVVTRDSQHVDLSWGEFEAAQPLTGDVVSKIQEFKAGHGGDAVVFGSPVLVRTLIDAGLIDEYYLVLHPVIVGVGQRAFDDLTTRTDLDLESVTALEDGGVLVAYRRAPAPGVPHGAGT